MRPPMRSRERLLVGAAASAVVLLFATAWPGMPLLAQQNVSTAAPAPAPAPAPPASTVSPPAAQSTQDAPRTRESGQGATETIQPEDELGFELGAPPVELPEDARRDPTVVGRLDPIALGLGPVPWGNAHGIFLSTLLRRMDAPIASRWAHIALRNALLARSRAPGLVNPVDWAAERAWLLLRMGEADAARMIVSGVDVDQFTPKMFQVGVQSALANADPAGLCPLQAGIEDVEPQIYQLVDAMCAALAGEPEAAAAQIETARRRGRMSGIDVTLAEKVIGAASEAGRAVTVEWEPVERLNAWRFGLATATGMTPPERLIEDAPLQLRAWQAQAPMIAPSDRLNSAEIAAGLGVFSSQAMVDLHSLIYDSTGPDDLPETDAWQLRLAFIGADETARLAAMRRLWEGADDPLERVAVRAMLGRAAARVDPEADLQRDAGSLIASMLAAGLDRDAARWATAISRMDDDYADTAWAMIALGAPADANVDRSLGRISSFIGRDNSRGKKRSALLVAGLSGLGYLDSSEATRLNERYGLRLERRSRWTQLIDRAAALGQSGTVLVLAGTGLQAQRLEAVPSAHLLHIIGALKRTGQDYNARMIAAEALAPA